MTVDALKLDNVKKNFAGTEIIRGLNLSVAQDERHAVIGPNGAGKSTAYNLITGRYEVSSGKVFLKGEDITNLQPYEVKRKGLSRSFQITNIFPKMSVFENVRCSLLWAMGYKYSFWQMVGSQSKLNDDAEKIIEELNLKDRRNTLAGVLSYAEQRALEIGITIAGGSEVILLDEPTAGMSVSETEYIVGLIRKVTEGKTLLVVEHDMGVVFDLADRISVLVYGEIIATGTPREVKENQAVQEAYLGAAMEDH
ncbi:ABC transporter ATP-binding protein [Paracoccaceae bacterium]|nr:ABC transporter ATP-binding protein [Paracoccaceae bacterium]